ncbi:hypothetical protein L1987_35431 [Smallanthus sonchifolius]|uniref:Uncharacterized protein n=1 Tax=Smallanthus sonchifolius TaxID=185202 RepID=A0ACB9HXB7_9ASTR|nr:hypothetical protein L1987_35431 [Smallanthus sonchifolius]
MSIKTEEFKRATTGMENLKLEEIEMREFQKKYLEYRADIRIFIMEMDVLLNEFVDSILNFHAQDRAYNIEKLAKHKHQDKYNEFISSTRSIIKLKEGQVHLTITQLKSFSKMMDACEERVFSTELPTLTTTVLMGYRHEIENLWMKISSIVERNNTNTEDWNVEIDVQKRRYKMLSKMVYIAVWILNYLVGESVLFMTRTSKFPTSSHYTH